MNTDTSNKQASTGSAICDGDRISTIDPYMADEEYYLADVKRKAIRAYQHVKSQKPWLAAKIKKQCGVGLAFNILNALDIREREINRVCEILQRLTETAGKRMMADDPSAEDRIAFMEAWRDATDFLSKNSKG